MSETNPVAKAVRECLAAELGVAPPAPERPVTGIRVAAAGTTAKDALGGAMLAKALAGQHLRIDEPGAFDDIPPLLAEIANWDLGVVLSPFKRKAAETVGSLTPSAAATGVVDTIVPLAAGPVGVNTNAWAVTAALDVLVPAGGPGSVLLLGAGASARSTALGIRRTWPDARLVVAARRHAGADELAAMFQGTAVDAADTPDVHADVIVNATTWGETSESEKTPFVFPFADLLRPGSAFFDLNNRRSGLQDLALAGASAVMSGTLMQVITHACRAALARYRADEGER
ncbi:hypothetical protein ACQP1W_32595 [Spirillospora sp. CA-255316]